MTYISQMKINFTDESEKFQGKIKYQKRGIV